MDGKQISSSEFEVQPQPRAEADAKGVKISSSEFEVQPQHLQTPDEMAQRLAVQNSRSSRNSPVCLRPSVPRLAVQNSRSSRNMARACNGASNRLAVQNSRSSRNQALQCLSGRARLAVQNSRSSRNSRYNVSGAKPPCFNKIRDLRWCDHQMNGGGDSGWNDAERDEGVGIYSPHLFFRAAQMARGASSESCRACPVPGGYSRDSRGDRGQQIARCPLGQKG